MCNYLSFAFSAGILGPWCVGSMDVIYAVHGNATIGFPAWLIGAMRRAPFVVDIQDLWPDSITASGMLPSVLVGLIPLVEAWCQLVYRGAARIGVLSEGFKGILESRGVPDSKIRVIHNWCNEIQTRPGDLAPEEEALLSGRFNVVAAGNMGKMQGFDVVLDSAAKLQRTHPNIQFVLVGGGVDHPRLQQRAKDLGLGNVLFLPRRPVEGIGALLHRAEALLVHLKDDPLFRITIPSRIQSYLAVGRPILCGVRGNASDLVTEAGAGICFQPDDPGSLAEALQELVCSSPEAQRKMGDRGREFYWSRLAVAVGTRAYVDLFSQCLPPVQTHGDPNANAF